MCQSNERTENCSVQVKYWIPTFMVRRKSWLCWKHNNLLSILDRENLYPFSWFFSFGLGLKSQSIEHSSPLTFPFLAIEISGDKLVLTVLWHSTRTFPAIQTCIIQRLNIHNCSSYTMTKCITSSTAAARQWLTFILYCISMYTLSTALSEMKSKNFPWLMTHHHHSSVHRAKRFRFVQNIYTCHINFYGQRRASKATVIMCFTIHQIRDWQTESNYQQTSDNFYCTKHL
jgi:hypothetical protein